MKFLSAYSKRDGERIGTAASEEDYHMVEQLQSEVTYMFII